MTYYVTMTDKWMSGWGVATGKTSKLVIVCETSAQAEQIVLAASLRPEMRFIRTRTTPPRYGAAFVESRKTWADLGPIWTGIAL